MEALEHQAGILFRTLILAHITGRDVPYLSGEALAGLTRLSASDQFRSSVV